MNPAGRPRLLIVDDEVAQMRALCETLALEGYATTGFSSPSDALAALQAQSFDLLLTDLMMPQMDGIELMRQAHALDADLVAILMTGHGAIDTAVEAMQAGALDYILKPFRLRAVQPVLERALKVRRLRAEKTAVAEELEAFSYSVSHDLRAPLRAVSGFSEILLQEYSTALPEGGRRMLEHVREGAQRMDRLIDDLLRLSQLSRRALSMQSVQLDEVAREVFKSLADERAGRQIEFRVTPFPPCRGDAPLLRQVLANLITNALKFTRGRAVARIEVSHRDQDGELVCCVTDNGAGFDMKYAAKLFGAFQRLHSAEQFEGTGVGLSIVKRVIQRHGGRVWAHSKLDEETTFCFSLPATP